LRVFHLSFVSQSGIFRKFSLIFQYPNKKLKTTAIWVTLKFVTFCNQSIEEIMERTFIMIKPDGVQRHLTGEIIHRFESKGFTMVGMKMMQVDRELAEKHYEVHKERPFFKGLVDFIISAPVIAMVWEGEDVIAAARNIIGATNPVSAAPGSIRGDLGVSIGRNLIHGSDAPETASLEVALWFKESELVNWEPVRKSWLYE
jgi:nucleoside-diphosphate kinase